VQNTKPRALTTRAQSLDLTSLSLSRSVSASMSPSAAISETPDRIDSPTDSGTNPSPPTSAMIPSFPSVYGPSAGLGNKPRRPLGVVEPRGGMEDMDGMFAKFTLDSPIH